MMEGNNVIIGIGPSAERPQEQEGPRDFLVWPPQEEEEVWYGSDDDDSDDDSLPDTEGPDDPRRMALSTEEIQWALDIQYVIEHQQPELDPLSDFWYAQLAIVCRDDTAAAVGRATRLQEYRREYGIRDDQDQGRRDLRSIVALNPEMWLWFGFVPSERRYGIVYDVARTDLSSTLRTATQRDLLCSSGYYLRQCLCPDLEAVRRGSTAVMEHQDLSWGNFKRDFKLWQKVADGDTAYPYRIDAQLYNAGVVEGMLMPLIERILPPEVSVKRRGLRSETRLDQLYSVPTLSSANRRLLVQLERALEKRYENAKTFRIPKD